MLTAPAIPSPSGLKIELVTLLPNCRALAWRGDRLYISRNYDVYSARMGSLSFEWQKVGAYCPPWQKLVLWSKRESGMTDTDRLAYARFTQAGKSRPGAGTTGGCTEASREKSEDEAQFDRISHVCIIITHTRSG